MYTITVCTWTSHSNSLFHIQIATPFSLSPVITSFLIDLYQSCPFRRPMSSASLWNKHKIPHLCPKFLWYHSLLLFALLNLNWSSPRISSVSFQFPSLYPRHSLCSICVETECAMVASFCRIWLLFFFSRGGMSIILKWNKIYFIIKTIIHFINF